MRNLLLPLIAFLFSQHAHAFVREYMEDGDPKHAPGQLVAKDEYTKYRKSHTNTDNFKGGFWDLYRKFNEKVVVPGLISSAPLPRIGKLVGPDVLGTSFRVGDTVYLRWYSGPMPAIGSEFSVYTPAIVMQNMEDPTDFSVKLPPGAGESIPKNFRLAGYFYEGSGRIRVSKIREGIIEGALVRLTGQVQIGDELMPPLPESSAIKPIESTVQLSAAIVCGSPADRISTTRGSFIYINRGSRDGVKVGQVFEAIDRVKLDDSSNALGPEVSSGQAMVVYTSDSYSTAMIVKQFDVIRIGSLMRTANPANPVTAKAPFVNMLPEEARKSQPSGEEIPTSATPEDAQESAPNLPDPMKKRPDPGLTPTTEKRPKPQEEHLSDLDALEKSLNLKSLTSEEKSRLGKLSRQERLGEKGPDGGDESEDETPAAPSLDNSFSKSKKAAKKPSKKKKQSNDEEELNLLMMQN